MTYSRRDFLRSTAIGAGLAAPLAQTLARPSVARAQSDKHGGTLRDEKAHHADHEDCCFFHPREEGARQWRAGEQTSEQRESHELCLGTGEMQEERIGVKRKGGVGPQGDEEQQRAPWSETPGSA